MILPKLQGCVFFLTALLYILIYTNTTTATFSATLENYCDLVLTENLTQEIKEFIIRLNSLCFKAGN